MGGRFAGSLRRGAALAVIGAIWPAVPALASTAYWLLAIGAAIRWRKRLRLPSRLRTTSPTTDSVSILKPVYGRDPHFYEAIRSHALQDYPQYEILFGIGRPDDPAADDDGTSVEFCPMHMRAKVHARSAGVRSATTIRQYYWGAHRSRPGRRRDWPSPEPQRVAWSAG